MLGGRRLRVEPIVAGRRAVDRRRLSRQRPGHGEAEPPSASPVRCNDRRGVPVSVPVVVHQPAK